MPESGSIYEAGLTREWELRDNYGIISNSGKLTYTGFAWRLLRRLGSLCAAVIEEGLYRLWIERGQGELVVNEK